MSATDVLYPLPAYLWQVALHSWVLALVLSIWTRRVGITSGRTRRLLLAMLLLMPLATAAVPGRGGVEFGERIAWFNSWRLLTIPLGQHFHVADVVLLTFALTVLVTLWQLLRPTSNGRPGRSQLRAAKGPQPALTSMEMELAAAHDRARAGFQARTWLLFVARLVQSYNPLALWAFREYRLEVEIASDSMAVAGHDPHALARVLLKAFQATERRDKAGRTMLRRRVDVLVAVGSGDAALPATTVAIAALVMLLVLPWIV